jgi:septal ring factor EnvC (AmiA/AmiB activator)
MNNLLFCALLLALLYYFFYYLPQKKDATNPPLQHNQSTQTETLETNSTDTLHGPGAIKFPSDQTIYDPEELTNLKKDIQQKERTIIGLNNSYNKLETKSKKEIDNLKNQIKTMTHQLAELKTHQNTDEKALENSLDNLLKDLQDLSTELE